MVQMPIDRLHYSMMTQLLRNPLIFKMKYVFNVYDVKIGTQGMIGRAGHAALKAYYGGDADHILIGELEERQAQAIELGHAYIAENAHLVDFGKTGSHESLIKGYSQAMQFYFSEEPQYHEIVICEEKIEAQMKTLEGQQFPMPAAGIPDLVHKREDDKFEIVDTKFVKSFTDPESEDYIKIIQSQFLFFLLLASRGIKAERMVFREIKTTENKGENAGKSQIQDYVIPYDHTQYHFFFYNIFNDVVSFLRNPNAIFLPNLSDVFDGEQAGLLYAQGLISAGMDDVEVIHKVKDVAFTSKKFVASRLDRVENKNLPPQEKIKMRLIEFGIPVEPVETKVGASVTQYRFKVSAGVRMSVFEKHKADIARAIEAKGDIVILAPIPGTQYVGIEVPSEERKSTVLSKDYFVMGTLSIPVGLTVQGDVVRVPLNEMPHLLIAGATGSGKSVLLHSTITSLTKQMMPSEMRMIMIDPKRVELAAFNKLPHLRGRGIVYEYDEAQKVLQGLTGEMELRYRLLEKAKKRDISEYNAISGLKDSEVEKMSYIVVVIDEFADLILRKKLSPKKDTSYGRHSKPWLRRELIKRGYPGEFSGKEPKSALVEALEEMDLKNDSSSSDASMEFSIVRLAQMARAVGIHLIIATQRPSVDVITGLIKANFPTRIALTTASATDSKVILGEAGAEKLTGKGDMIFMHPGGGKQRLQGFMIK